MSEQEVSNWNEVCSRFSESEWNLLRHSHHRNFTCLDDVKIEVVVPFGTYAKLNVDWNGWLGVEKLPSHLADTIFVGVSDDGTEYLINTEGHDYCRYIARLVVVNK